MSLNKSNQPPPRSTKFNNSACKDSLASVQLSKQRLQSCMKQSEGMVTDEQIVHREQCRVLFEVVPLCLRTQRNKD